MSGPRSNQRRSIDGVDGCDYVRENFRAHTKPSGDFRSYDIVERLLDLRWYFPLGLEEARVLNTLIREIDFCPEHDEEEFFEVELTATKLSKLVALKLRVYLQDVGQGFGTGPKFSRGDIVWAGESTLLGGIVENRIPLTDKLKGGFEDKGDSSLAWVTTDNERERHAILRDINRRLSSLIDPEAIKLSRKILPFYTPPGLADELHYTAPALYKLETSGSGDHDTAFFVWAPGVLLQMDWSSTPIHDLNSRFADTLSKRFAADSEHICEYMRFFCDLVAGDEGPFTLVESLDHPRFANAELKDDDRETIEAAFKPLETGGNAEDGYTLDNAIIWYGDALFRAKFSIGADGLPEMLDDEPISSVPAGHMDWDWNREHNLPLKPHSLETFLAEDRQLTPMVMTSAPDGRCDDKLAAYVDTGVPCLCTDAQRIRGRVILGDLDLSGANAHHNLEFRFCRFRGDVDLSSMVCDSGIRFADCVFEKSLTLNGARIEGSLEIDDCTVIGQTGSMSISAVQAQVGFVLMRDIATFAGVDLYQSRVRGNMLIRNLEVRRFFGLVDCTIDGSVLLDDVNALGVDVKISYLRAQQFRVSGLTAQRLHMLDARVEGTVAVVRSPRNPLVIFGELTLENLQASVVRICGGTIGDTIGGGIDMNNATIAKAMMIYPYPGEQMKVKGSIDLRHLSASTVTIAGVDVGQEVTMRHACIEQFVHLSGAGGDSPAALCIGGGHTASDDDKPGGLDLYGAEIRKNYLYLNGVDIAGDVLLDFARIGTGLFIKHESSPIRRNHIGGKLSMTGMIAPRGVFIIGARIGKDIVATGLQIGELRLMAEQRKDDDHAAVEIIPLEIGGSIDFSQAKITQDASLIGLVAGTTGDDEAVVDIGSLNFRRAEISGNLSLYMSPEQMRDRLGRKNLIDQPVHGHLPGGINLNQVSVGADLNLSHVQARRGVIDLKDAKIGHDILAERSDPQNPEWLPACTNAFLGSALQCGGDVDLTGLSLDTGESGVAMNGAQQGSVMLEQSVIAGRLMTYKSEPPPGHIAEIPGCLNLTASEIGQVDISWHGFQDKAAQSCGIVMEQAKIGTLSVTKKVTRDGERFPVPVRLKFMEVKWWDFNRKSDSAEDYISFLESDKPIQSHTYYAVENTLMNQGQEDAADKVHIAMHERIEAHKKDERAKLSRFSPRRYWLAVKSYAKQFFLGFISGYGTKVWRPSMIIFFWWLISGFIFSYAGNIVPSEEGLAATHTDMRADTNPMTHDWHVGDGLWVAIRYHLPIVAFGSLDEWEPGNDSNLVIPNPANRAQPLVRLPFSPESYAFTVVSLHYILLPMAVFAASRKVLRRREVG